MFTRFGKAAVVPVVLAMGVLTASPALAAGNTMSVRPTGQLLAKGAGVVLTVSVTCSPETDEWGNVYDTVEVNVALNQNVKGGKITSASAQLYPVTCNDRPQRLSVLVMPTTLAFKKGVALATGRAYNMGASSLGFDMSPTVVTLK